MDKKKVCKLRPGTMLEILWLDSDPTTAMLLEKPQRENGDISLRLYHFDTQSVDSHVVHTQVHTVLGFVTPPVPTSSLRLSADKPRIHGRGKKNQL